MRRPRGAPSPRSASPARRRFRLTPERPYSLALTAERAVRFPEAVDRFDGSVYRRLLVVEGAPLLVEVRQRGTPARAVLDVSLCGRRARGPAARTAAERLVRRALGAGQEVRPFYRAFRDDPLLGPPIRRFRGLRGMGAPSLFEAILTAIFSQQVNLAFAYSIRRELALRYGRRARLDGESFVAFPSPERLARESVARLRGLRLSGAKAEAVRGVARALASGVLAEAELEGLDDARALERLTALRGVGRWTGEIALIRGLARADVFPAGDLGVVQAMARGLLGRAERAREDEMRRFAERWRPYRSLALVYAYAELRRRRRTA